MEDPARFLVHPDIGAGSSAVAIVRPWRTTQPAGAGSSPAFHRGSPRAFLGAPGYWSGGSCSRHSPPPAHHAAMWRGFGADGPRPLLVAASPSKATWGAPPTAPKTPSLGLGRILGGGLGAPVPASRCLATSPLQGELRAARARVVRRCVLIHSTVHRASPGRAGLGVAPFRITPAAQRRPRLYKSGRPCADFAASPAGAG